MGGCRMVDTAFVLTVITAGASLVAAAAAGWTTRAEARRAKTFRKEFREVMAENTARNLELIQSINVHGADHQVWGERLRGELEKSLASQEEMVRSHQQFVEENRLLADRTPQEWGQWARRVSGVSDPP